jgi:NADPH:quinone reductase-like Zn-dependent oxidoreductase
MSTARKWIAADFGGPDVLREVETEVPAPGQGEVTITVRAAGVNPADYKRFAPGPGQTRDLLPLAIGSEVSGVISAIGPETEIASGGGAVGDEVVAFRISGGYASALTVAAADVFAKPASMSFAEAANLLLVGTTAAEMLEVTGVASGDTMLLHGASGAVGVSVLQQARLLGAHVVGTASERNFDLVRQFGGTSVAYGEGLEARVREAAPGGIVAALDTAGTDEAVAVSLALVADRARIVSIVAADRAKSDGFRFVGASNPMSASFRARARAPLIRLAAEKKLVVPVARTFPLSQAKDALEVLMGRHPSGKLALLTET